MPRIRRILHPSDFSAASRRAFAYAVAMARGARAELLVVHVLTPPVPIVSDAYVSPKVYEDLERSSRAWGQKQIAALVARAKRAGARVRGLLLEGVAADQIVRAARSRRADLIVMGTHGRGGFARLLLGSVAERVIATARCPVLTVRGR
ncbi:MAG: universal stress protein [Candidatus Rokubacteria bacterium]|nr:universal stress protein [Candidatus Rokubacteria bacterium]